MCVAMPGGHYHHYHMIMPSTNARQALSSLSHVNALYRFLNEMNTIVAEGIIVKLAALGK